MGLETIEAAFLMGLETTEEMMSLMQIKPEVRSQTIQTS
jgi:hypothetical protein